MKKNELLKLNAGTIIHIKYDDQYLVTYMKLKNTIHNIGKRDIYGVDNFYNLEYDVNDDMTMENSYYKKVKIVDILEPDGYKIIYSKFNEVENDE